MKDCRGQQSPFRWRAWQTLAKDPFGNWFREARSDAGVPSIGLKTLRRKAFGTSFEALLQHPTRMSSVTQLWGRIMKKRVLAAVLTVLGVLGQARSDEIECTPKADARIKICSYRCSNKGCAYGLVFSGERRFGKFMTYYTRDDGKPIIVPNDRNEFEHQIEFSVSTDEASLHMELDEQPDFSLYVKVETTGFSKEFRGVANESIVLDDLKRGQYTIRIIKEVSAPGGRTANYVPMIYIIPTVKNDEAGDTREKAKTLGSLSLNGQIEVDDYLQEFDERGPDGRTGKPAIKDRQDVFQIRTTVAGVLHSQLKRMSILDSDSVPISVSYLTAIGPEPIPDTGRPIEPGEHYVMVAAHPNTIYADEYGIRYHLNLSLK
jgi:hypothetical protein